MKKTLIIIASIIAAVYVIISAVKGIWNPFKWFATTPPPAEGSACTANGKQGTIKNGQCVVVDVEPPVETELRFAPSGNWSWFGRRRLQCYTKPAGTSCVSRIWNSSLGWGVLYSGNINSTTCCYLF